MMEATSTSQTLVNFYQTTRRNNPEDSHLPNIGMIKSRRMGWVGEINTYILVRKPERKTSSGRPMSRWEDNTKMDVREIGREVVDWIYVP
jgi:hypothetical protein